MSENKILERRRVLAAALKTLNYQIRELKHLHSREQVRCWYVYRRQLKEQLSMLPTPEQLKASAKRHTALVKTLIHKQ